MAAAIPVRIAEHCEWLYCIEGRAENVAATRQAIAASHTLVADVEVVHSEIHEYLSAIAPSLNRIDLIWARGILYHFEDPVSVIRSLGTLRQRHHCPVIGWTHLAATADARHEGVTGQWYYMVL